MSRTICILFFIALLFSGKAWSQFSAQKNFVTLPGINEVEDSIVLEADVIWSIAIKNYIDLLEDGATDIQSNQGLITLKLLKDVQNQQVKAFSPFLRDTDIYAYPTPLELKNGVLHCSVFGDLMDFEEYEEAGFFSNDSILRNFYFTQFFYWNKAQQNLTSRLVWAGYAEFYERQGKSQIELLPVFQIPVSLHEKGNNITEPVWTAQQYFEQAFSGEDVPLTKKMYDYDFIWLIWSAIEAGKFPIKDLNSNEEMDFKTLKNRCSFPERMAILDPVTMKEDVVEIQNLDLRKITHFGVLQEIAIYADWSATVEIKGLKILCPADKEGKSYNPAGWIVFD